MDSKRFDALVRAVSRSGSRRAVGRLLAGLALAAGFASQDVTAKRRKRHKGRKRGHAALRHDQPRQASAGRPSKGNARPNRCPLGQTACKVKGRKTCVDLQTDTNHCGKCRKACAGDQICQNGQCASGGCTAPQIPCSGICVDPGSDGNNCGNCGTVCSGQLTCIAGSCGCASGTKCGTNCVDLQIDATNCGACGHVCPTGQRCQSGGCVSVCAAGKSVCASGEGCSACCADADCATVNPDDICASVPPDSQWSRFCCLPNGTTGCISWTQCCSGDCRNSIADPNTYTCLCKGSGGTCSTPLACCSGVCKSDGTCT